MKIILFAAVYITMHGLFTLFLVSPLLSLSYTCENVTIEFPEDFMFGSATSAYQIEGGWDEDGKSPSVWDTFTHNHPDKIIDHSNADISVDSYHLYKKDVAALKSIGFQKYRFSISWSRVIINGTKINPKGIEFYNNLINELISNNIEPVATMFHWDLPQYLQDLGGFANPLIVNYFEFYANVLYKNFGDRVKTWITINEPITYCLTEYARGVKGAMVQAPGVGEYLCGHHSLLCHATAYRLYKSQYFNHQKGEIGISLNFRYYYPKDETVRQDYVDNILEYVNGWFLNPIFSKNGNYPGIMVELFKNKSKIEGIWSRLPVMSAEEIKTIRGSADFLGINYYTSTLVSPKAEDENFSPFLDNDINVKFSFDKSWIGANKWLYIVPQGFYDLFIWIRDKYDNPKIFVTENGYPDLGGLADTERINYVKQHLAAVSRAIKNNCNIVGYNYWSLLDNFEWTDGYDTKFGLFYVNISSTAKERIPKKSAEFFKNLIKNKKFDM